MDSALPAAGGVSSIAMRKKSLVTLAVVMAAVLSAAGQDKPTQKFTSGTHTVPVFVTVTDRDKRLVPDLVEEDFEIYDNGKLQKLTQFDNSALPISVVVMLDTSGSMTLALDQVKQGAEQFLMRLLPEDRAMVGAFNDKIQFMPSEGFIASRDRLIAQLKELDFGYPTRLWDAVYQSLAALKPREGRKVVLVFTDGEDTASKMGRDEPLERAREEDVMIYAVGLENIFFNGAQRVMSRPDRGLKGLAEETGGGFFLLKKTDELGATFTRVAQEIHSQYLLGFSPSLLDGKVHKLEIRVKKTGMTARARKTYVATSTATTEGGR
jgi:Ca-activated chloride channel family protein